MSSEQQSSGVQELISQLREDGVVEGRKQAESLVEAAQREANAILAEARQKSDELMATAQREADQFKAASEESLKIAVRDTVRDMQSHVNENFRNQLRKLVVHEMSKPDVLRQMILAVAAAAAPEETANVRLLLSAHGIGDEEVGRQIETGELDDLTDYARGMIGDSIRQGFSVGVNRSGEPGIRVQVVEDDVEIDMTADAISDVIAQHLLPRFRAIMKHS